VRQNGLLEIGLTVPLFLIQFECEFSGIVILREDGACRGPEPGQAHPAGGSAKKALTPGRRRELVAHVEASHGVSERRSCAVLGAERSSVRYTSHRPDQTPLVMRIRDLAAMRMR
jgi:putative transposase